MSVWAITMVKDEADVIEATLRHVAAQGVEGVIVADNGSTDGTREILSRLLEDELGGAALRVHDDPVVGYYQSRKMTALAEGAHREYGATWIWPFDADELWYHGDTDKLASVVEDHARLHPNHPIIQTRLWHHFPTAVDAEGGSPFERMVYRSGDEAPIGKVIVRWQPGAVILAGNHGATVPGNGTAPVPSSIQVRHFPYRSEDQFVRKAVNGSQAYAATDLPWGTGQHWREYGVHYERGGEDALRRIYREHFYYDLPSAAGLVYDPARIDG
jgi:hypothetical protein